jgi:hypothetical protein
MIDGWSSSDRGVPVTYFKRVNIKFQKIKKFYNYKKIPNVSRYSSTILRKCLDHKMLNKNIKYALRLIISATVGLVEK